MPRTGYCFLIGSLAIAAAPGLNGFLSEFLLYLGAFKGILFGLPYCLIIVIGLAAIGGLAAVCFSGVFGTVFLGEKRGDYKVHEVGVFMSFSLIFLAASCFLLSLFFPYVLSFFSPVISQIGGRVEIEALQKPLFYVIASSLFLLGLVGILFLLRKKRPTEKTVTWDCGYAKPTSRMQYNFSSFVEPLGENFKGVFGSSTPPLLKIFPQAGEFVLNASDLFYRYFYKPLFQKLYYLASKLRWLQQGSLHLYILYIFLTLLFLLIYKLQ